MTRFLSIILSYVLLVIGASCKEDNLRYLSGPIQVSIDSVASSNIWISWKSIDGAAIYSVVAGTDTSNNADFEKIVRIKDLHYVHDNLSPNTEYFFLVGAHPEIGNGVQSEIVLEELENAPEQVKDKIKSLDNLEILENNLEIKTLAQEYLDEKIVTNRFYDDALHIACATINKIDVLVSWNFKHTVNLNRIHLFNSVNLKSGYGFLEIRTPMELLNE